MDMKLSEFLINSQYSSWVTFLSVVVFTVGAFAYIAEKLSQDNMSRTIQDIWTFMRPVIDDLRDLYHIKLRAQSRCQQIFAKWFEITTYCVFAAAMYLYFFCILVLIFLSNISGMKLIYSMLFSLSLFVVADVCRRYAHRVRTKLVGT